MKQNEKKIKKKKNRTKESIYIFVNKNTMKKTDIKRGLITEKNNEKKLELVEKNLKKKRKAKMY